MYLLAQATMLTKAKQTKKCSIFKLRTLIIIKSCHGSAVLLLFILFILLLNNNSATKTRCVACPVFTFFHGRCYLHNAHVQGESKNAAGHAMIHINSLGRTGAGEGAVSDGIPQAHFFLTYPYHLDRISSSAFLIIPVPNSLFFLRSHMLCHNEDKVASKVGHDLFFQGDREDCELCPFCHKTVKCRENRNNRTFSEQLILCNNHTKTSPRPSHTYLGID